MPTPDDLAGLREQIADILGDLDPHEDSWTAADRIMERVRPAYEALVDCEEVLRLIHDAAGPVERGSPMPRVTSFEAWLAASSVLAAARTNGGQDGPS